MKKALLTILRDRSTQMETFKAAADRLCLMLAAEVSSSLKIKSITVKTPYQKTEGLALDESIVLVVILRSGLAMLTSFMYFFPTAKIGFLGLKRNEKTAIPTIYYEKLPPLSHHDHVILLDPMIATGGSASLGIKKIIDAGGEEKRISLVGLVCAPEGIQCVKSRFPKIHINIAAKDQGLNAEKFIVPGVGDFGDRYFGTLDENT